MNLLKRFRKPLADVAEVTTERFSNPNKPLRPGHWKRWYYLGEETRVVLLSKMRWWFFLIYPAWVTTHLEDYKPDPVRVRRAFYESQLGSPASPLARMANLPPFFEEEQSQ